MNLMTRGNQTRHQLLSNRSRRSCHKHSHHRLLDRGFTCTSQDKAAAPAVTPQSTRHEKAGARVAMLGESWRPRTRRVVRFRRGRVPTMLAHRLDVDPEE